MSQPDLEELREKIRKITPDLEKLREKIRKITGMCDEKRCKGLCRYNLDQILTLFSDYSGEEELSRLEIIDYTKEVAREVMVMAEDKKKVTYSVQDDGQTLKVFVADKARHD